MKKIITLVMILLIVLSSTLLLSSDELIFEAAHQHEDLSEYKEILTQVYLQQTKPGFEDYTKQAIENVFHVLVGWIDQKGKRFIKIRVGEKPIGYMTLEALDYEETKIAFHQSPLLPEYNQEYKQFFDYVKHEFPNAQMVYTTCSQKTNLHTVIKKFGFTEDDAYHVNQEIGKHLQDLIGYSKQL